MGLYIVMLYDWHIILLYTVLKRFLMIFFKTLANFRVENDCFQIYFIWQLDSLFFCRHFVVDFIAIINSIILQIYNQYKWKQITIIIYIRKNIQTRYTVEIDNQYYTIIKTFNAENILVMIINFVIRSK